MIIGGAPGLNGKIKVEILDVDDVTIYIYEMPNSFSDSYGTHGLLENGKFHQRVKSGVYTVPTDWSIWIVFNPGVIGGGVSIRTWAEEYTEADVGRIESEW